MPNALTTGFAPAAPPPNQLQGQQNGQAGPMPPGPGAPGPQGPAPAPSHEQTVCAMRHFHAITQELEGLLNNPNLGRSDIKSAIIDGTTKLVAGRILTPAEAVKELGSVPKEPGEQRKWVQQHFAQTMMAQNAILDQHRQGNPGTGNWAIEAQHHARANPDDHLDTVGSLMSQFQGHRRG